MTPGTDEPDDESTDTDESDTEESAPTPDAESNEDDDRPPEAATSARAERPADSPDDSGASTPADQEAAGDTPSPETKEDPPDATDTGPSDAATDATDQTADVTETPGSTADEETPDDTDDPAEATADATSEPSDAEPGADSSNEGEPAAAGETDAETAGSDPETPTSDADAGASQAEDAAADADTSAGRDPADLTPDEVEVSRPEEYEFKYLPKDLLPPDVQYTPEFDPDWVYPSGTKDGGTRDDVPVQGLEIGVLASEETVEQVIEAVLEALELYHDVEGVYPRHRIVESATTFRELTDWDVGLAAVFQPRPGPYDDLTDHMMAIQQGDADAVDANHDRARRLAQFLLGSLVYHGLATIGRHSAEDLVTATNWDAVRQVADTAIVERYGPLAATEVYDPTAGAVDISTDGVDSVTETDLSPAYLEVEDVEDLF